jgi:predicted RNase H-like nuclease
MTVRIHELSARSDPRGESYSLPLPFTSIAECHIATIRPASIRGNHFHTQRRELLTVLHADRWTLFWDEGEGTEVQSRAFEGTGAVLIDADPLCAHAVRNDGATDLQLLSLGDTATTDTLPRVVTPVLTKIAGLDGCREGWIAAIKDKTSIEVRIVRSDEELLALIAQCAFIAIDIPIGLPDTGARTCDERARGFIGRRGSSVFPAPVRALLGATDYRDANRLSKDVQNKGISQQGFAIIPKIAQIDRILQAHQELRGRVHEVHPEVSFASWNGSPMDEPKTTREGLAARRALVSAHFGPIPPTPRGASEDDLLDAMAALWTAERILEEKSQFFGGESDATGLPMKIAY